MNFKSKKDFKKFAKASFKRAPELSEIISTYGFNKQIVADGLTAYLGPTPTIRSLLLLILAAPMNSLTHSDEKVFNLWLDIEY